MTVHYVLNLTPYHPLACHSHSVSYSKVPTCCAIAEDLRASGTGQPNTKNQNKNHRTTRTTRTTRTRRTRELENQKNYRKKNGTRRRFCVTKSNKRNVTSAVAITFISAELVLSFNGTKHFMCNNKCIKKVDVLYLYLELL